MRDYSQLFERIQQEIPADQINVHSVARFINATPSQIGRMKLLNEFIIAFSITQGERFATERKITMGAGYRSNVYDNWGRYHRKAVVIFKGNRIKAWKYI